MGERNGSEFVLVLGLNLFPFGMKKTRNSFQDLGNTPFWRISLKVSRSTVRIESRRLVIIWLSILSRPGVDLILLRHLLIAAVCSVWEKGLEKRAEVSSEGVKEVGKEGQNRRGEGADCWDEIAHFVGGVDVGRRCVA